MFHQPPQAETNSTFRLPLLPIFAAYTIGIYFGHFDLPFSSEGLILSLLTSLALWAILVITKRTRLGSWVAFVLFFLFGFISIHIYIHPEHPASHISRFTGTDRITLQGILDRPPQTAQGRTQLFIQSENVILSNRCIPVEGTLLLFHKGEHVPFHLGDRLRFMCKLYSRHGFRNPGGFSYERHLAFERVHTIGFLSDENLLIKVGEGFKNPLFLRIEGWRDHIRDFLEKKAEPPCSSIFKALVLGEQENIPEEVKEYFALTGTAHLLAISGDQFGIVAILSFSFLIWILRRSESLLLYISVRKLAAGLTIPCIVLYAFIAGGGTSVIRAAIMVVTFLLSILFDRERNLLHTLALAAFLILLFSPPSLFDVSFQLSFLAVLSILYIVPRILEGLRKDERSLPSGPTWKKKIWQYNKISLLVTAVATFGTAPFVALHFNRLSPIGLVSNLFVIPWVGFVIVPLSLSASIFSFFLSSVATFLIHINGSITLALLRVLAFFSSFPFASFFISTPTTLEIILFYFLLFLAIHLKKRKVSRHVFVGLCVVLVLDLAFWDLKGLLQKDLTLTFIDVGQGDSILIEFPKGKRMLIDGGGLHEDRFDIGKNVIAPFLWKKKIHRIDYLVLTHPDPDHLKGLNFIALHFSIGQFWDGGLRGDSEAYFQLAQTLSSKKTDRFSLSEKTPVQMIDGVQITFLNPPGNIAPNRVGRNISFFNNHSLVMKLQFRNINVLLAGDIEKEVEDRLTREGCSLRADILKIPHHGSASSSTPQFLESVKPTYAILSVGERNIGRLPHPEVLKRYERLGTKVFRTDRNGAITVVTDGEKIEVRPFHN